MPDLQRCFHSARSDMSQYDLFGALSPILNQTFADTIEDGFKNFPPSASLPISYGPDGDGHGGPAVDAADVIYFCLPSLDPDADVGPVWRTSIMDLVAEVLEDHSGTDENEQFNPDCHMALRARLLEIVAEIDRRLAEDRNRYAPKPAQ